MTDAELFMLVLHGGPLLASDAIVVLCGEDCEPRLKVGVELFRSIGAPTLVLTGGIDRPPMYVGAERAGGRVLGLGVAPDRVLIEPTARNTREQAVEVVKLIRLNEWGRVLLVASGWHMARAFLTFVARLKETGLADTVHLVPVPEAAQPWFAQPIGHTMTRLKLAELEADKIVEYGARGHAVSYAEGLDYLRHWEQAMTRALEEEADA